MAKSILVFFFCSLGVFSNTTQTKHPLYISITDMEWNSKENSIEVISKIFIDDFEAILARNYNKKIDLYVPQNTATQALILDYLQKHLQIAIDGKSCTLNMIGYERQKEACWCYVEIKNISSVRKVGITNTILHDYTEKQINLIHTTVGNETKNTKLAYPESTVTFDF